MSTASTTCRRAWRRRPASATRCRRSCAPPTPRAALRRDAGPRGGAPRRARRDRRVAAPPPARARLPPRALLRGAAAAGAGRPRALLLPALLRRRGAAGEGRGDRAGGVRRGRCVGRRAPAATSWTSCWTAISTRREARVASLVADVAAACRAEGAELVFLDASGAAKGYATGRPEAGRRPRSRGRWASTWQPSRGPRGGIGAIAYAADPARVALDLDAYRAAAGPDVALEAVLRPARPDCTDAANLAEKLAVCRQRGVRAAGFYHYGLAPASAIDRVGTALAGAEAASGLVARLDEQLLGHQPEAGQQAAVDAQHLAGDERRLVGGQERDRRGDLLGRADAAQRIPAGEAVEQVGLARPGAGPTRRCGRCRARRRCSGCRGARSGSRPTARGCRGRPWRRCTPRCRRRSGRSPTRSPRSRRAARSIMPGSTARMACIALVSVPSTSACHDSSVTVHEVVAGHRQGGGDEDVGVAGGLVDARRDAADLGGQRLRAVASRSQTTTRAPSATSRRQTAEPIPPAPPTTTARRLAKRIAQSYGPRPRRRRRDPGSDPESGEIGVRPQNFSGTEDARIARRVTDCAEDGADRASPVRAARGAGTAATRARRHRPRTSTTNRAALPESDSR